MTHFAANAAQLAGLAARALGWSPECFWTATPSELFHSLGPSGEAPDAAPSRDEIEQMIERDRNNGR